MKPIGFNENCYSFWLKVANNRDLELAGPEGLFHLWSREEDTNSKGSGEGVGVLISLFSRWHLSLF